MRGIRETIEYRVECDGINRNNERCTNATPYFSDREFPHPLDPDVDAEAQANKWAVEHGWRWKRMYRNTGDVLDFCPDCWEINKSNEE